jgi:hypothetical protein
LLDIYRGAFTVALLKLELLTLKFHKIIRLRYYLVVAEWYNIICVTLQYLLKAMCLCGCI